jgi:hypothetical protein
MICVYVGGAYSADNVIGVFGNIRRGMHLAKRVLDAGLAWLEKSEAMLVVQQNLEGSKGTQAEMERARGLGIPIFYELQDLCEWRATRENATRMHENGGAECPA